MPKEKHSLVSEIFIGSRVGPWKQFRLWSQVDLGVDLAPLFPSEGGGGLKKFTLPLGASVALLKWGVCCPPFFWLQVQEGCVGTQPVCDIRWVLGRSECCWDNDGRGWASDGHPRKMQAQERAGKEVGLQEMLPEATWKARLSRKPRLPHCS